MKLITQEQSRELDNIAIKKWGIPGIDLMGKAGSLIAEYAQNMTQNIEKPNIAVICGKGSNAGDGYKSALDLSNNGYTVDVLNVFGTENITGDSKYFFDQCIKKGIQTKIFSENNNKHYDLIIDAILGTGFKGELKSPVMEAAKWINIHNSLVLSVDIPSGVHANNGFVADNAVKADVTVTMGFIKVGMMIQPAKALCGEIIPVDIGFPDIYSELPGNKYRLSDEDFAFEYLKAPDLDTHKHRQGKVLILAGSQGMTGAAILASNAAVRSGAGLVTTFAPKSISNVYENNIIEGLTVACDDNGLSYFSENNFNDISKYFDWADALLIGPGIGQNESTLKLIKKVISAFDKPIIIDADGLRLFFNNLILFNMLKTDFVITPHFGELANLLNDDINDLKQNIINKFEELNNLIKGVVVAKNAPTFILNNEEIVINTTGNQGMATGGTGDVLSGVIASFVAQRIPLEIACELAVFVHGKAADLAKETKGIRGLIASDIINHLPKVLKIYE